jgi:hypothetical protein
LGQQRRSVRSPCPGHSACKMEHGRRACLGGSMARAKAGWLLSSATAQSLAAPAVDAICESSAFRGVWGRQWEGLIRKTHRAKLLPESGPWTTTPWAKDVGGLGPRARGWPRQWPVHHSRRRGRLARSPVCGWRLRSGNDRCHRLKLVPVLFCIMVFPRYGEPRPPSSTIQFCWWGLLV